MQKIVLDISRCKIRGTVVGKGSEMWVALHGFGEDRKLWRFLDGHVLEGVRLVKLDLPFFGESIEMGTKVPEFTKEDVAGWLEELKRLYPETEKVTLIAYSLGGKVALGIFEKASFWIKKVILICPDGLKIHPLYHFCAFNPMGRFLFNMVIRKPDFFLYPLRILHELKVTDAITFRFVEQQFRDPILRLRLKSVWWGYRYLRSDLKKVASRTRRWNTDWHLIWGEHDKVLPWGLSKRFLKMVPGVKLHLLDEGHLLLHPPSAEMLNLLDKALIE